MITHLDPEHLQIYFLFIMRKSVKLAYQHRTTLKYLGILHRYGWKLITNPGNLSRWPSFILTLRSDKNTELIRLCRYIFIYMRPLMLYKIGERFFYFSVLLGKMTLSSSVSNIFNIFSKFLSLFNLIWYIVMY